MTFEKKFEEFLEAYGLEQDTEVYREVTAINEIEEKRNKIQGVIDIFDKQEGMELDEKTNSYIFEIMEESFWKGFDDAKDNVNLWTELEKVKENIPSILDKIKENTFEASEEYNECFDRIAEKHEDNSLIINLLNWHAEVISLEAYENCLIGYMTGAKKLIDLSYLIKKKGRPSTQEENALSS